MARADMADNSRIVLRAIGRIKGNRVARFARKYMGRIPIVRLVVPGLVIWQFTRDAEAHGVAGAVVRATPLLGDIVTLTDITQDIGQQLVQDADDSEIADYEEQQASVDQAARLARYNTLRTFEELSSRIQCPNPYPDSVAIGRALEIYYATMQEAYWLDSNRAKDFNFKNSAARARKILEDALQKEAQKSTPAMKKDLVI